MTETQTSTFENLITHPHLLEGLKTRLGFAAPTQIQTSAMPPVLEGQNVFAGAKTGSGKTIAFLAPIAQRIFEKKSRKALILAPTRELVLQIDEEAEKLLQGQADVVSIPLYGGVPVDPQVLALRIHKPKIFIATPGRIFDLVGDGILDLSQVDIVVLDEADRMCDMGFAPQVTRIFDFCTEVKQTLFFSATLPKELTGIMDQYCTNPVRIQVDPSDKSSETIRHKVIFTPRRDKVRRLRELIAKPEVTSIVFMRTRSNADRLFRMLLDSEPQMKLGILHAGFEMNDREASIRAFKEGHIKTMIATDVAARGLDVEHLTHVVHFELPDKFDDYLHRSGRSGRAGRSGTTYAMVDQDDREQLEKFKEFSQKVEFEFMNAAPTTMPDADRGGRSPQRGGRNSRSNGPQRGGYDRGNRRGPGHRSDQQRSDQQGSSQQGSNKPRRDDRIQKPKVAAAGSSAVQKTAAPASKIKRWFKGLFG